MFKLTEKNYYSNEAGMKYMSASQFKAFHTCPAATMAELRGDYKKPQSRALLVGQYMDALWSPEEMDGLMLRSRPEIEKKDGTKRADIQAADIAYERAHRDPVFRHYVEDGEHQEIYTGEIAGVPYKIKMDSYFPGERIVDLKLMKDMEPGWKDGKKVPFCDLYDYPRQLAIYQQIVAQNEPAGELLPCYLAVITKEATPQIEIIQIPQWKLTSELEIVKHYSPLYQEMKTGRIPAPRCEHCDFCRETKKIEKPILYEDLLKAIN